MFSDMLKYLYPDLWWVLSLTMTSVFVEGLHILHKLIGCFLKDLGHQIVFILIMAVERGSVDHGTFGNIAHRDSIEPFLCNQFNHRFLQELMGAPNAQVCLFFVRLFRAEFLCFTSKIVEHSRYLLGS